MADRDEGCWMAFRPDEKNKKVPKYDFTIPPRTHRDCGFLLKGKPNHNAAWRMQMPMTGSSEF